jgi:hypothetical protein
MTQNSKCCVNKVKILKESKRAIATFDCLAKDTFYGKGPDIGEENLCPTHRTSYKKLVLVAGKIEQVDIPISKPVCPTYWPDLRLIRENLNDSR